MDNTQALIRHTWDERNGKVSLSVRFGCVCRGRRRRLVGRCVGSNAGGLTDMCSPGLARSLGHIAASSATYLEATQGVGDGGRGRLGKHFGCQGEMGQGRKTSVECARLDLETSVGYEPRPSKPKPGPGAREVSGVGLKLGGRHRADTSQPICSRRRT